MEVQVKSDQQVNTFTNCWEGHRSPDGLHSGTNCSNDESGITTSTDNLDTNSSNDESGIILSTDEPGNNANLSTDDLSKDDIGTDDLSTNSNDDPGFEEDEKVDDLIEDGNMSDPSSYYPSSSSSYSRGNSIEEEDLHEIVQRDILEIKDFLKHVDNLEVEVSYDTVLQSITIIIPIPTYHLSATLCEAWGLIYQEQIRMQLEFDQQEYIDANFITLITKDTFSQKLFKDSRVFDQLHDLAIHLCEDMQKYTDLTLRDVPVIMYGQTISAKGFLLKLFQYISYRLNTLNEHCIICDKKHVVGSQSMLKPVVCDAELCNFSQYYMGVSADIANVIKKEPSVSHLLKLFTEAAVFSHRHDAILDPYPTATCQISDLLLSNKNRNQEVLQDAILHIPSLTPDQDMTEAKLRELLSGHPLSYGILRWIINSNRSHIVKLPTEKQLGFVATPHQYLLKNSPPAKDEYFNKKRSEFGSVFAFHGSPIENWHSIVRRGLLVFSGTERQLNGAAYGAGIYLSPGMSIPISYCNSHRSLQSWGPRCDPYFVQGSIKEAQIRNDGLPQHYDNLKCLALCEVINDSHLIKHNADIWTCTKGDNVCTRFFFVFDDSCRGHRYGTSDSYYYSDSINTSHPVILQNILQSLE